MNKSEQHREGQPGGVQSDAIRTGDFTGCLGSEVSAKQTRCHAEITGPLRRKPVSSCGVTGVPAFGTLVSTCPELRQIQEGTELRQSKTSFLLLPCISGEVAVSRLVKICLHTNQRPEGFFSVC